MYAMHDKGTVSPDLMLGYAGIGSFFLRITRSNAPDLILGRLGTILEGGRHRNGRGSEGGRNVRENTAACSGAAEFG